MIDSQDRFWSKISKTDGCWLWVGALNSKGYGNFWWDGRYQAAHRVSFVLAKGEIPPKIRVLHHCDTPACVRPDHLFLGTQLDNIRDMWAKGRSAHQTVPHLMVHHGDRNGSRTKPERLWRGEKNANSKLREADVRAIRSLHDGGKTYREIAAQYGVSFPLIGYICRRDIWRHVA